jgi:hypothetical protein
MRSHFYFLSTPKVDYRLERSKALGCKPTPDIRVSCELHKENSSVLQTIHFN